MKRIVYATPALFSSYPIVFLFVHNRSHLRPMQIILPLAVFLIIGWIIQVVFYLLSRNGNRAALISSVYMIVFTGYGHFQKALEEIPFLGSNKVLLPAAVLFLGFVSWQGLRVRQGITRILQILFVVGITLNLSSLGIYLAHLLRESRTYKVPARVLRDGTGRGETSVAVLPDIYYIVPDHYTNSRVLLDEFHFDNGSFLDFLDSCGFFVVPAAVSNYPSTAHSLASSLNMCHLLPLAGEVGPDLQSWLPLYDLIENNRLVRQLRGYGYKYIHMGTWWAGSRHNRNADLNINLMTLSEFRAVIYQSTIAYPVGKFIDFSPMFGDYRVASWKRIIQQFARLEEMPSVPGPKFVFVHLILPHPPYVFRADGSYRPEAEEKSASFRENYLGQIEYANAALEKTIDRLITESAIPPVIILQADEGPFPERYEKDEIGFDWRSATAEELRLKFGIINAIRIPGLAGDTLYPGLTPINTFRIILNHIFGERNELVPDRSYCFVNRRRRYDFF